MRSLARIRRMTPDRVVSAVDGLFAAPYWRQGIPYGHRDREQLFFIVGCGRSGNTLLRNLLCKSYFVCIPPEIPGLGNTIRRFTRIRRRDWVEVVDGVIGEFKRNADVDRVFPNGVRYNLERELGIDYSAVREKLLELPAHERNLGEILVSLYRFYAERSGLHGAAIGDKTPWNAFHIERIHKVFPAAKFVHVLRDPRATAASYAKNFNGIRNVSVEDAALRWRDSNHRIERFASKHRDAFLQVRYEDLVSETEEVLVNVAGHLLLKERRSTATVLHGDEELPHYSKSFGPVKEDSLDKWRSLLSSCDVRVVEEVCHRQMRMYGYS